MADITEITRGTPVAESVSMSPDILREHLGKAVEALRKAEQNLLLFPWDEVRRRAVERQCQEVDTFRATLKAVRRGPAF